MRDLNAKMADTNTILNGLLANACRHEVLPTIKYLVEMGADPFWPIDEECIKGYDFRYSIEKYPQLCAIDIAYSTYNCDAMCYFLELYGERVSTHVGEPIKKIISQTGYTPDRFANLLNLNLVTKEELIDIYQDDYCFDLNKLKWAVETLKIDPNDILNDAEYCARYSYKNVVYLINAGGKIENLSQFLIDYTYEMKRGNVDDEYNQHEFIEYLINLGANFRIKINNIDQDEDDCCYSSKEKVEILDYLLDMDSELALKSIEVLFKYAVEQDKPYTIDDLEFCSDHATLKLWHQTHICGSTTKAC